MKTIKVNSVNFWEGFDLLEYLRTSHRFLTGRYAFELSNKPDVLFCSVFGDDAQPMLVKNQMGCKTLMISHENVERYPINYEPYDYIVGFDYPDQLPVESLRKDQRYERIPFWVYMTYEYGATPELLNERGAKAYHKQRKFCSFVYSNPDLYRQCLKHLVETQVGKEFTCGGRVCNNTGTLVPQGYNAKVRHLSEFNFNFACENSLRRGYATEKILHPFLASVVPIYYGDPEVDKDFNANAMIWLNRPCANMAYQSFRTSDNHAIAVEYNEAELNRLKHAMTNPDYYADMLNQPVFANNEVPHCAKRETLLDFYDEVFS